MTAERPSDGADGRNGSVLGHSQPSPSRPMSAMKSAFVRKPDFLNLEISKSKKKKHVYIVIYYSTIGHATGKNVPTVGGNSQNRPKNGRTRVRTRTPQKRPYRRRQLKKHVSGHAGHANGQKRPYRRRQLKKHVSGHAESRTMKSLSPGDILQGTPTKHERFA